MAEVLLNTMMPQHHSASKTAANAKNNPMFHDFLGVKHVSFAEEPSPAASVSASWGGGCGGGPVSTTSDLGSERQVSNHFEGVSFYTPRSDISAPDIISNRLVRYKRDSSDSSAFMGSARDHTGPEGHENMHLMKMLRNGSGGERRQWQAPASLILHPAGTSTTRTDPRFVPTNVGPTLQFPPRGGPFMPMMHHGPLNRYCDIQVIGTPVLDEGSRTRIKGPGTLSSVNIGGGLEKNPPLFNLRSVGKSKLGTRLNTNQPECSNPPSRDGLATSGRQMTIFYGGQAHVFDEVAPNKAELVMAVAGSNGGSWSTTFSPKSSSWPSSDGNTTVRENETLGPSNTVDLRAKIPLSHGLESVERFSNTRGDFPSVVIGKDAKTPTQEVERVVGNEKSERSMDME